MPFTDVLGHDRLTQLLARAVGHDQLPPSLILAGPSGVGKRLTAVAIAQAFNCSNLRPEGSGPSTSGKGEGAPQRRSVLDTHEGSGPSASASGGGAPREIVRDSCGTCSACVRIAKGLHPDVVVVEPGESGSIRIEQIRACIDHVAFRPFEGRRRVVIIDDADGLVAAAQNALLKTLEEPPPSSTFILITSRPDALLPTVTSRCPRLTFRPLDPGTIVTSLTGRGVAEHDARTIAASAEGSLGRALAMSASDLQQARAVARQVLAAAAASSDPRRRIDGAKAWLTTSGVTGAAERGQMATHLRAMASLLRDTSLLAAGAGADALANADARPALDELVRVYRDDRGTRAFAAVDRALVALERNVGVKIIADWLVLQL